MSSGLYQRLRAEVDLIERFTSSYGQKFEQLIERLNRTSPESDLQCVRLCVEAVNMMISSQSHMAQALKEPVIEPAPRKRAA